MFDYKTVQPVITNMGNYDTMKGDRNTTEEQINLKQQIILKEVMKIYRTQY